MCDKVRAYQNRMQRHRGGKGQLDNPAAIQAVVNATFRLGLPHASFRSIILVWRKYLVRWNYVSTTSRGQFKGKRHANAEPCRAVPGSICAVVVRSVRWIGRLAFRCTLPAGGSISWKGRYISPEAVQDQGAWLLTVTNGDDNWQLTGSESLVGI